MNFICISIYIKEVCISIATVRTVHVGLINFSDEVARMFESKDKDLDGRLSFEEFMGEASRAEKLFKLMDKDGDGYVTKHVSAIICVGLLTHE